MSGSCQPFRTVNSAWGMGGVNLSKMASVSFGFSLEVMKTQKTTLASESQCMYVYGMNSAISIVYGLFNSNA